MHHCFCISTSTSTTTVTRFWNARSISLVWHFHPHCPRFFFSCHRRLSEHHQQHQLPDRTAAFHMCSLDSFIPACTCVGSRCVPQKCTGARSHDGHAELHTGQETAWMGAGFLENSCGRPFKGGDPWFFFARRQGHIALQLEAAMQNAFVLTRFSSKRKPSFLAATLCRKLFSHSLRFSEPTSNIHKLFAGTYRSLSWSFFSGWASLRDVLLRFHVPRLTRSVLHMAKPSCFALRVSLLSGHRRHQVRKDPWQRKGPKFANSTWHSGRTRSSLILTLVIKSNICL